ncbi:MAG: hypothetical protein QOD26_3254 [Betaproteobacteria bacterium]|jgi:hypothetical protein|nr:hypothetical protein [Betaproteobacteria bacterium]
MVFGYSAAQEAKKKTPAKKAAAHAKATPEQIRKFNQLQEKQKK